MKWFGETVPMKKNRLRANWTKTFAIFPKQMPCGTWIWFEHYERKMVPFLRCDKTWFNRLLGDTREMDPSFRIEPTLTKPPSTGSVLNIPTAK